MNTAQHSVTRCPVLIHPAAASNPFIIRRLERETGMHVITAGRTAPRLAPSDINDGSLGGDAA